MATLKVGATGCDAKLRLKFVESKLVKALAKHGFATRLVIVRAAEGPMQWHRYEDGKHPN
jgi:hypothetical protein